LYAGSPEHARLQGSAPEALRKYLDFDEREFHYKVFVAGMNGGFASLARTSFRRAVSEALERCNPVDGSPETCRLFAVGDVVVIDMSDDERERAIADYKVSRQRVASLEIPEDTNIGVTCLSLFSKYRALNDLASFKVFVLARDGPCSYRSRSSYGRAREEAVESCSKRSKPHYRGGGCFIFAVGNRVVWEENDKEIAQAERDYEDRKNSLQEFDFQLK
jgi:hypothetical protein